MPVTANTTKNISAARKVLSGMDSTSDEIAERYVKKYQKLDRLFESIVTSKISSLPKEKLKSTMSVNDIADWFKQLESKWIAALARHGMKKVKISFNGIYGNLRMITRNHRDFSEAIQEEGMYAETIDTVVRALKVLEDGDNVALNGLIQSCKSGSQTISAMLFGVVHFLKTGQKVLPIFLLPNGDSYVGQFRKKLSWVQSLIYEAKISFGKKSTLVKEYYREDIQKERNSAAKDFVLQSRPVNLNKVMKNLSDVCSHGDHIVLPVSKLYQDVIRILVNSAHQNGWLSLIIRDESHNAVSKNGINDKMFGGSFEDNGIERLSADEKAIYEMIQ